MDNYTTPTDSDAVGAPLSDGDTKAGRDAPVTSHTAPAPPKTDLAEIRRALTLVLEPGQVAELRVLHANIRGRTGTVSGYFDDFQKLAEAAAAWSGKAPGIYITLNSVNPDLLARAANRVREFARETTSDADILRRRWLPIDFDAKRAAGISSTDVEHAAALERSRACREWLRSRGWPDPVLADSGNGGHLLYRVDLPANDGGYVERCLKALAAKFDDNAAVVDVGNYNPARIWKIYGTLVSKGDNMPDRPHRLARILESPQ